MKIGVVIARFQIDTLHEGHKSLLNHVKNENDILVVLLGCSQVKLSTKNPLDFKSRRLMIWESFPGAHVFPIYDQKSNEVWSLKIDDLLLKTYGQDNITLYGSRDSFIPFYSGNFKTQEFQQQFDLTATDRRKQISTTDPLRYEDFRAGVIYAAYNQYPKAYPTVDVAIMDGENILLGRKPGEDKFRFIGGFVDPTDLSLEAAAKREVNEECSGIEVDGFEYISSRKVDDWRYKGDRDGIMTTFFKCDLIFGKPLPSDDIEEIKWFKIENLLADDLVLEHIPLFEDLINFLNK